MAKGHSGEPGSLLTFLFLMVDAWFRGLLFFFLL